MTSECCLKGVQDHGTPTGSITKIAGLDVYVAEPANFDGKAVLFLHDIFGLPFLNNKLLSDDYAKLGNVRVYLPDLFHGDAPSPSMLESPEQRAKFDFAAFKAKHPEEIVWQETVKLIEELKAHHGVKKIASIGFCYGGWITFRLGATDLVDAVAGAHPSMVKVPEDIENIKKPSLWLLAETDQHFSAEVIETTKKILEAKKPQVSIFHYYPGVVHGFAVRGRTSEDKVVADAAADARTQAVKFFNDFL